MSTFSIALRTLVLTGLLAAGAGGAQGQLRPLDPLDWDDLAGEGRVVSVGAGMHWGQRATRAGSEGLLLELGRFRAAWGLGSVSVELAGTAVWLFEERSHYAEPAPDVLPTADARRRDSGDYRVSTLVRLTPGDRSSALALRFGVRLPTTDDLQGLERDQTDFFAGLAGRTVSGPLAVGGEIGLGVFGTRDLRREQVDVLLFGLSARYDVGRAQALLELAGQHDTRSSSELRGNEDLGEARLGVRVGHRRWIRVALIRGWTPASPDVGVGFEVGTRF